MTETRDSFINSLVILSKKDSFNLAFALARQKASEFFGQNFVVYFSRYPSLYVPPSSYLEGDKGHQEHSIKLLQMIVWLEQLKSKDLSWRQLQL